MIILIRSGKWITSNGEQVKTSHCSDVPNVAFGVDQIERNIKFLKLLKVLLRVQLISVYFEEFIPAKIESLKLFQTAESFENGCW